MRRIVSQIPCVWSALLNAIWLVLSGCAAYAPPPAVPVSFDQRAQTQRDEHLRVSVTVLSPEECRAVFGVPLYDVGVQPIWLHIENLDRVPYLFFDANIGSCTSSLRIIHAVRKPGKIPSFHHWMRGALRWYPSSFYPN
jgi:hypothetical protein